MVCLFVFFLQRVGRKRQEAVGALFGILFISGYGELFRQMLPEVTIISKLFLTTWLQLLC